MNNFQITYRDYILKLIPDLSVFDLIERHFIDNNKSGMENLFFYNITSDDTINFKRFIIKTNIDLEFNNVTPVSIQEIAEGNTRYFLAATIGDNNVHKTIESVGGILYSFKIKTNNYYIIMAENTDTNITFKTNITSAAYTDGKYMIGVCF